MATATIVLCEGGDRPALALTLTPTYCPNPYPNPNPNPNPNSNPNPNPDPNPDPNPEQVKAARAQKLTDLFAKYVPVAMGQIRRAFKPLVPLAEFCMAATLCTFLDGLLTPDNVGLKDATHYELYFTFAAVWACGSALSVVGGTDYRKEFSKWWKESFKAIKFPHRGEVCDCRTHMHIYNICTYNTHIHRHHHHTFITTARYTTTTATRCSTTTSTGASTSSCRGRRACLRWPTPPPRPCRS